MKNATKLQQELTQLHSILRKVRGEHCAGLRTLHSCLSELVGGKYKEPVANFRHTQPLLRKDALLCCTCVGGDVAASYVTCLVRWNWLSLRLTLLLCKALM